MAKNVKVQEVKLSDNDFEKLEQSIVKAMVESNKQITEEYSVTREWMKFLMCPLLFGVAVLLFALGIGFIVVFTKDFNETIIILNDFSFNSIIKLIIEFMVGFFVLGLSVFSYFAGKEIDKENDKSYVASIFSYVVSLTAVVIALIALVRGW